MSEEILSLFKPGEVLSYYEYIDRVLYTPEKGYYAQSKRKRVGYSQEADFYTSMSVGDGIFGKLLLQCIERLLPEILMYNKQEVRLDKQQIHLIEMGAEPGYSIIDLEEAKSFPNRRVVRLDESVTMNNQPFTILFANELLDAQPFQRFRYSQGEWYELGVHVTKSRELSEVILEKNHHTKLHLSKLNAIQAKIRSKLSYVKVEEGYILDYPTGSELLLQELADGLGGWKGMMIMVDYGYSWQRLSQECPQGTGRGYKEHRVSNDLLQHPAQMDITCHICWDNCREVLANAGFNSIQLESQEKFLVQYASDFIQKAFEKDIANFSKQRQALMQLLHPTHMGQKFQVLWGMRL